MSDKVLVKLGNVCRSRDGYLQRDVNGMKVCYEFSIDESKPIAKFCTCHGNVVSVQTNSDAQPAKFEKRYGCGFGTE